MKKMTATERLLAADKGSLKRQRKTKEVYSPSLSDLLGDDIYITIAAIDDDLFLESANRIADENDNYSSADMAIDVAVDSILEPNFRDERIYSRFEGAVIPEDAVRAAFSAKELYSISNMAVDLGGNEISEKEINEVKN